MASGTGAGSATISINTGDVVFDSRFHHSHAGNPIGLNFRAVVLNENNLGHILNPIARATYEQMEPFAKCKLLQIKDLEHLKDGQVTVRSSSVGVLISEAARNGNRQRFKADLSLV